MLDGLYQSAIVFFIPYVIWTVGMPVSHDGRGIDSLADFGTTYEAISESTYVWADPTYYISGLLWLPSYAQMPLLG